MVGEDGLCHRHCRFDLGRRGGHSSFGRREGSVDRRNQRRKLLTGQTVVADLDGTLTFGERAASVLHLSAGLYAPRSGDERHQRCPHGHQTKRQSNNDEIGAHRCLQPLIGSPRMTTARTWRCDVADSSPGLLRPFVPCPTQGRGYGDASDRSSSRNLLESCTWRAVSRIWAMALRAIVATRRSSPGYDRPLHNASEVIRAIPRC